MSRQLLNNYYNKLEETIRFGGSRNETTVEHAFIELVNSYAERRNLRLVPKIAIKSTRGTTIIPDGTLKNALRLDFGYWESKDIKDDIDREIQSKINKGYPLTNTLFEDSRTAVLYQDTAEVMRVPMKDAEQLERILHTFVHFEPPQVQEFNKALVKFTEDVPTIVESLRHLIETEADTNRDFIASRDEFLANCRTEINPEITLEDVREMMIQHILTADIFTNVFANAEFHRHNNIARELEGVIETFMTYGVRQNYLGAIRSYYDTIRDAASGIADHHEKQKFLKTVYENFYKVYNPKGADRLGVVYTPNEVVRFMIESTDYLLEKHFGRSLADKNVEILDPATGTGTFVAELIEHIPPQYLAYKYEHEIHANEVAILPYYIANLNIEYTYQQKMGAYNEFKNICFVDTLDNTAALDYKGKQSLMFGISSENAARIKSQNERKISVIIGNPPYNAKQANYNFQNSNRAYKEIDKRIKDTYIKHGAAQNQIVVYDMYTRFFRWASDRLKEDGVVAFVSNSSFIDSQAFDGFRKVVAEEFNEAWIINLKGNARTSGERRRREAGNVFDDQIRVGVAVYFFVKNSRKKGFRVYYNEIDDYQKSTDKKNYLSDNELETLKFESLTPDKKHNWINQSDNDWDSLLPLVNKNVKSGKSEEAVFKLFSRGVASQRDEWVFDFDATNLESRMRYFTKIYERTRADEAFADKFKIKWDRELGNYLRRNIKKTFEPKQITKGLSRPFVKQNFYFDRHFNGMVYQWQSIFRDNKANPVIALNVGSLQFVCMASDAIVQQGTLLIGGGSTQCLPFYSYNSNGRHENITAWGLMQFRNRYEDQTITREDIFHYTYAVLHHPAYRRKYALNLKREFPRLPFYEDFRQWAAWGGELMDLHINYETAKPYKLKRVDAGASSAPRPKLKADKVNGAIELDSETVLQGVPSSAWEYKLGNRSALEWVLDQYKEKKLSDATIAEKFNTYRFADYKESVIDLLERVCTVSLRTVEITDLMPKED